MEKITFKELKERLGAQRETTFGLENQLNRLCKIKFTDCLTLEQWDATLEFMTDTFDYAASYTLSTRLKRHIGCRK